MKRLSYCRHIDSNQSIQSVYFTYICFNHRSTTVWQQQLFDVKTKKIDVAIQPASHLK